MLAPLAPTLPEGFRKLTAKRGCLFCGWVMSQKAREGLRKLTASLFGFVDFGSSSCFRKVPEVTQEEFRKLHDVRISASNFVSTLESPHVASRKQPSKECNLFPQAIPVTAPQTVTTKAGIPQAPRRFPEALQEGTV